MATTTIQLRIETADELHELKQRGESYDDVVQHVLETYREYGPRRADPE